MRKRVIPKKIRPSAEVDGPALVGRNVRRFRTALRWSQEHLAELTELHWTYISSIERGKRNVGVRNICALASALGKQPRELLTE